jgi:hypothetical protein
MRELGLTAEEFKKIAAEVKENHAKLDACPGPHLFVLITPGAAHQQSLPLPNSAGAKSITNALTLVSCTA